MKAVVGYSDKTVEQVKAEIDARDKPSKGRKTAAGAPIGGEISKSHVDALAGLQAAALAAKAEAQQG